MSVRTIVDTNNSEIHARVELTETHLISKYYVISTKDLPNIWAGLSPDEQSYFLESRGRLDNKNVDDIQQRTDGVFLSWDKSHPQWTVTFTYTNSEVVSAPTRELAIQVAREAIAGTYGSANRDGASQLLGNADINVDSGNYGM